MLRGVIITVIGLVFSLSANAQLTGVGSLNNPYKGTLTGNLTITGVKYFGGDIIVDNETLTIDAGSKFISTSHTASIKIIGTGVLYAVGTSSSPIVFTGDTDKDKINGETTDTWGDIYITSTAASTLSYCTVEEGLRTDVSSGTMGGGIYLASSSTTLNNCIIRNCTAVKGGGIYVASGYSPSITNCLFRDNKATENGGAVYAASAAAPVFTNDIFFSNSSTSATYKGGAIASVSASPVIVNSVFAYNTSSSSSGNAMYLENSGAAKIVNSVLWGSNNLVAFSGTTSSVFTRCALQGATYPGCVTLNSINTATDGPNFTNPTSVDFSITFDSPLRDAGVSTLAGATIPSTDYYGNRRIGPTDIGIYEIIYSRWVGIANTDWLKRINWEGNYSPGTTNIVIPAGTPNYPTLTPAPSFTLNSGLKMIIEPGAKATFTTLTNNGTILLNSRGTSYVSLMVTTYSGASGSLNINDHIDGGEIVPNTSYEWHYIAPPVTVIKSVITSIDPYNLMNYDQSAVTTDISQGWQWHDGYQGTKSFSTLNANQGYLVYFDTDTTIMYKDLKSMTTTIGQINLPFSGSGKDSSIFGYSCIGNSLTCAINWDLVTLSDTKHVRNAIYIQDGDVVASYVNKVGTNGGSPHIPPFQGFIVKTTATGTSITIPNTAKEHDFSPRYKSATVTDSPLVRLKISSPAGSDETVLRIESSATNDFDPEFDADKLIPVKTKSPQIYTLTSANRFSINTIPWPQTSITIPLVVKIPSSGTYTINVSELHGLGSEKVYLKDNTAGSTLDLTAVKTYNFTADAGSITSRFSLIIGNAATQTNKPAGDMSFRAFQADDHIAIIPEGENWTGTTSSSVRIYDSTGNMIFERNNEYLVDRKSVV